MKHKPRKRFGQNFLHDAFIIENIISSAQVSAGQHWVEIGPGRGALTELLLNSDIHLDVIELDRDLVALLRQKFSRFDNLTIHNSDALKFDFTILADTDTKMYIIGNLPYNISTPLMFHLLKYADSIADMHFMLQKEIVDRICATPGSKKYGRLSIMLQYHCEAKQLFDVPPESFTPVPKVMSAIIKLTPYPTPPTPVDDIKVLNEIVTQAFSQRRKTLRNSLGKIFSEAEIIDIGIDPSLRAEAISLQKFANLSNHLSRKNHRGIKNSLPIA